VSKTEKIDPITESTLAQLLDVYSQLSTQEAQLQEQLESIQQKRQSLQVVIDLFSKTEKAHVADSEEEAIATPQPPTEKQLESVEEKIAPPQTTSQSQTSAPSLTETSKGQKTISSKKKSQAKKSYPKLSL
jgi:hypothetical protein